MPPSSKPRPPRRPAAPSRAPSPEAPEPVPALARRLDDRLLQALGQADPPVSVQSAAALIQALRATFSDEMRRWFPLVPEAEPGRAREAAREASLDLADLRVLYRALRVAWLAELVFGERELAHRWLCQPKRRLHGRVPLLLCQYGRYAAMIEQWLVNIDEGNGP
ncbi:hypothetical protein C2U31_26885 [Achromobacter sp. AONIH1]|nr:hypothetical protein C2U31_26885 [Achromobacter sp. AONIH1]